MPYYQIGGNATGARGGVMGNVNCRNALKIRFTTALSSHPRLEAWDNAADLAAKSAPGDEILAGTASTGSLSWLAGADTSGSAPGASWYPAAEKSGGTSPSLLCGSKGYVLLDAVAAVGVASRLFNIALKVPSDAAQVGTTQHTPVIAVRYYYTGTAPGVIWQRNNGTEVTAAWATVLAGSAGKTIHFTGPDTITTVLDPFTKPDILTEVDEYWVDQ